MERASCGEGIIVHEASLRNVTDSEDSLHEKSDGGASAVSVVKYLRDRQRDRRLGNDAPMAWNVGRFSCEHERS